MSFKPGKYAGSTYVAQGVSEAPASQSYCSNCGSRVEPGVKKCPYCGRLGTLVTQVPRQGYGVMKPAHGDANYGYAAPPEPEQTTQKVCSKCGTPIPPGSSLCPIHGKFGGGNTLKQGFATRDTSIEAEAYRKMAARGTEAADQKRAHTHRTPPEDTYPQMAAGQPMPQHAGRSMEMPPETQELRACPSCGASVPDRSKVCPNCGNNRLPAQASRPIQKAEEFYKSRGATAQGPSQAYSPEYASYGPPADQYYGQPQQDPYYGQPALQPYEVNYPVSSPSFIQEINPPDKKGKKGKTPKEAQYKEAARGTKKSPWPMLLALLALTGVIIIAAVLIMDMLKTPTPITTLPSNTNPGIIVAKPPVISDIKYSDIEKTSATVTWKTDNDANSIVIYCLEDGNICQNAKDDTLTTSHSVKLTDLEEGKAYHITVKSMVGDVDASQDAPYVLRTSAAQDTTPPVITEVKAVNLVGTSATITWRTDEPATSQVSYGTSAGYGTLQPEQTDTTMLTSHSVMLNGLPAGTVFHYKVTSRDAAGNEESSKDSTFTTPAQQSSGSIIGTEAPDFTLTSTDGSSVTLSSFKGKKVIINFWNLDCQYCMKEMPDFQTIRNNNADIAMLMINTAYGGFTVDSTAVSNEVANRNYTFTVLLDESGSQARAYHFPGLEEGIPFTFFLDTEGVIKAYQDGMFPNAAAIQSMLGSY